jgi:hypothetical protein
MDEDLERLKQHLPLLEYLQRHNWSGRRAGTRQEFVLETESLTWLVSRRCFPVISTSVSSNQSDAMRVSRPSASPRSCFDW